MSFGFSRTMPRLKHGTKPKTLTFLALATAHLLTSLKPQAS
jgi:hypothetical protein